MKTLLLRFNRLPLKKQKTILIIIFTFSFLSTVIIPSLSIKSSYLDPIRILLYLSLGISAGKIKRVANLEKGLPEYYFNPLKSKFDFILSILTLFVIGIACFLLFRIHS